MAVKNDVAGFFEKRELLYAATPNVAALRARGQALLAAGLLESALECFLKAGDTDGVGQVATAALKTGDAFGYEAALKALGKAATPEEWVTIGETALAAGQLWFAYRAFEKADRQEALERVRKEMFNAGIQPPGDVH